MVYVIQVCWQLASRIRTELVPSWSCSQAVWHIQLLCVQWKSPDDGQRNCLKDVEFYYKNKFEKLVHLVGFIIRICHDEQLPERQIHRYMMSLYGVLWVHLWSLDHFVFYETISSHHCPAYQAHDLCCHLWPVLLHNFFSTLSHKWHYIRKEVTEHKTCVLIFCTAFVWNISHSKKNWSRYYHKCTYGFT